MKQLIFFWNRLYYGIFEYHRLTQILYYKIISTIFVRFIFLFKRDETERNKVIALQRKNISMLTDPRFSTIKTLSDQGIMIISVLLTCASIDFISILFPCISYWSRDNSSLVDFSTYFMMTAPPPIAINYFFLWRKDRYLEYFKVFQKAPHRKNVIWMCTSILLFILSIVLFFLGLSLH